MTAKLTDAELAAAQKRRHGMTDVRSAQAHRRAAILREYGQGAEIGDLATRYNVSKSRIQQIITKELRNGTEQV